MGKSVERVLIVGGGISGLCLAVALRAQGVEVEIVEIKSDWTVYGVGVIQQSNVVRAMAQLGLVDRYLSAAFPFDTVTIYAPHGQAVATIPGRRLAGPEYPANLGISRLALHEVLSSAAKDAGAKVRLGLTVNALDEGERDVTVTLSNGGRETYDLVVGADGLYSKMRSLLFPDAPIPRFTGQGVWRYNFPRPPEVDHLQNYTSAGGGAGLVPISPELMYMFIVGSEPGNPRMADDQLHNLMRERASRYGGLVGALKDQITDPSKVVYKPVEVVMLPEPWYRGHAILIGDAAHATSPHLGQGAGMAIEDAVVLSQEVCAKSKLEEAFQAFMKRRLERCQFIVEKSELVGTWQMNASPDANMAALVNQMVEVTAQPI